ncbi:glycosyltransferase family 61 protein [Sulfuriflexus mobilis]|uniref:glycosyltransferase family 61 protein n=1 Tax=Sulfuriflexus mobilis TaxID=1811807 RepID=UPI001558E8E1|nr:glycosyltransferase family 61 protein [Sulfuriflexus mobilis]
MDKNLPPVLTPEDALNIIYDLRGQTQTAHHEQLLDKLIPAWMPSHRKGGVVGHIQSSSKVRNISSNQTQSGDPLAKLRNTWLPGRLYRNHLKKYSVARRVAKWFWQNGYPIYLNWVARIFWRKAEKWRRLIKLSDFTRENKILSHKLVDSMLVEEQEPKVFPDSDKNHLAVSDVRYTYPEIFVATIKNAMTCGGSNLILADDGVICHDLFDCSRDCTSEELHGHALMNAQSSRIRWLLHDKAPESIPVAATFVDACASNYAHWMTEVLPRLALFCAEERFKDIPIVVNEGLHENIMESLFLVTGPKRDIITLPIGRALAVDELYLTSVAGYVPFGRRTNELSGHSHGVFSPRAFEILRTVLNAPIQMTEEEAWPEKIFLRRSSGVRKVTNATEIERLLVAQGYVIVEPEKLTFLEQIKLFNNAKEIISSTGAALANAIVCKPGTQVAVLMGKHENMIYRYWYNMLAPIQIKVSYVLGNIIENRDLGIHGDFAIDVACLSDLLEDFSRK